MQRAWRNNEVATPLFTWNGWNEKYMYTLLCIGFFIQRRSGPSCPREFVIRLLFYLEMDGESSAPSKYPGAV